ncbi:MAG: hypothetical protein H0X29_01760 [Parachlamydiaceae bacterium]|nr:hypothetical protein [Parachlamydiaceae bacterium]
MSAVNMPHFGQSAIPPVRVSASPSAPINDNVERFVKSTKKIANNILLSESKDTSSAGTKRCPVRGRVHQHHYHDSGYNSFWNRPTIIVAPSGYSRIDREGSNEALRFAVGILSTFVGAAAFYAIGNYIKCFKKVEKNIDKNTIFKQEIEILKKTSTNAELVGQLSKIATLRDNILDRSRKNNIFNLVAVITVAAACTIAVVGAVLGAPALMATGTLLGLGVGAVVLVKLGMDTSESKQKRDANAILEAVSGLPKY